MSERARAGLPSTADLEVCGALELLLSGQHLQQLGPPPPPTTTAGLFLLVLLLLCVVVVLVLAVLSPG